MVETFAQKVVSQGSVLRTLQPFQRVNCIQNHLGRRNKLDLLIHYRIETTSHKDAPPGRLDERQLVISSIVDQNLPAGGLPR